MFKYWSIKRYGSKLLPKLEKRYGIKESYSASEIRTTVFKDNFNPKFLPLAYLLFLDEITLPEVMYAEYPQLDIKSYKEEIANYLSSKRYSGYLQVLEQ